jgi:hypothetical protein
MGTNAHIRRAPRSCDDRRMHVHVNVSTALVVVALVSSIVLLLQKAERTVPLVAVIASGVEALLAFGLMSLSLAKFRVDVVLPAVLAVAGVIAWTRASTKHTITSATLIAAVGAIQLVGALHLM